MELTEGIIVKTMNYKENSKIIFIITDQGKQSVEVKGANKITGHSRNYTFLLSKIAYSTSKHYLSSAKVISNYVHIRSDIDRLSLGLEIIEMAYTFSDHITDFSVFYNFLRDILDIIDTDKNYKYYYLVFKTKILYLLGIAPIFTKCVECNCKTNLKGFVINSGGMKCSNDILSTDRISEGYVTKDIKNMYLTKLSELKKNDDFQYHYNEDNDFLDEYLQTFMGYKSKTEKIMKEIVN